MRAREKQKERYTLKERQEDNQRQRDTRELDTNR